MPMCFRVYVHDLYRPKMSARLSMWPQVSEGPHGECEPVWSLAVGLGVSGFSYLRLSFLLCKMEVIIPIHALSGCCKG